MTRELFDESPTFLSNLTAGPDARRLAGAVVLISLLVFCALVPFASVQLRAIPAFILIYQSILMVCDLITASLLFGQFRIIGARSLLVLASAYLMTACMAVAHALSFPGVFAPQGLLGKGTQITAWLYVFWHMSFPLMVMGYALMRDADLPSASVAIVPRQPRRATLWMVAACVLAVAVATVAFVLLAVMGHDDLPVLMRVHGYDPMLFKVITAVEAINLLAIYTLWKRRRPHSILDLWVMVVLCAWFFDIALSAWFDSARFDLGYFTGRIYGLLAAVFVLLVLLLENGKLYANLAGSYGREQHKAREARLLTLELEALNQVLAEKNRELEQASLRKSEFLANMSHELRTPLNAIIGFSEILKDGLLGELPPAQYEYVDDIFTSGRHLLSLINDILDLSKVEAGQMALDLEPAEIDALLDNTLSIVRDKAHQQRIALTCEFAPGLGTIRVDLRKTKQIVYNLLSNAVKFTPDGGRVTLRARRVPRSTIEQWHSRRSAGVHAPLPESSATEFLEISVEDSGIGISADDAQRLFQPFVQLDSSLARRYQGTGLGLALVMKLAALHDGTVALESDLGVGSCFTVWLPWQRGVPLTLAHPVSHAREVQASTTRLVLLIEDDPTAADLIALQLESETLSVVRASSAEEALAWSRDLHPAVIILDIFLPGMDGWTFLEQIKQTSAPWVDVPVVIVSISDDSTRGRALGASHVLQKPVSRETLIATLQRYGSKAFEKEEFDRPTFIAEVREVLSDGARSQVS